MSFAHGLPSFVAAIVTLCTDDCATALLLIFFGKNLGDETAEPKSSTVVQRRRLSVVVLGLMTIFAPEHGLAQSVCDRSPILIRNARVWTSSGPAEIRDILFADDRVAAIAAGGSMKPSGAVRVLEGKGQTLLPGLIDLHLHLGVPGGLPESARRPRRRGTGRSPGASCCGRG
jgi:hypothetical protein